VSWVIYNFDERKFVAPPGLDKSFVRYADNARRFPSYDAAQAERSVVISRNARTAANSSTSTRSTAPSVWRSSSK
jgi:hypothetical protein